MRLRHTESVSQVPGNPKTTTRNTTEWICSDCDYFEEADDEGV